MADFFTSSSSPGRSPLRSSNGSGSGSSRTSAENPFQRASHPASQENVVEYYNDRFIPSRSASNLEAGFALIDEQQRGAGRGSPSSSSDGAAADGGGSQSSSQPTLNMLLRNELLGADCSSPKHERNENGDRVRAGTASARGGGGGATPPNLFRFRTALDTMNEDPRSVYDLSPVGEQSQRMLLSPRKAKRKIPKVPFKVLDAPALQDDFYLNLVDWSCLNVLAVGLGPCVYLWSACTSKVTKLCDLAANDDVVTSVSWTQRGTHLAIGTNKGDVEIWEAQKCKKVRTLSGHSARVGTMSWNSHTIASGSRDRSILLRDVRVKDPVVSKLTGHKQEVCGLKWSFDDAQLASGGNDNKLFIWSAHSDKPVARFNDHTAAVKAIAWSPHQHGLLASGGGTADRCIRFWNTLTSTPLSCVDTGSQVCNLMWSKNVNEIVSTHGYSLNQIIVWRYPSMAKVATLTGHTYRVLYLAMSPDGQAIVTGAGDETLRFWNVFPGPKSKEGGGKFGAGVLFPGGTDIR